MGGDHRTGAHSPASAAAVALLSELIRRGLRDIVLSPGSRSQALALAAAQAERDGAIELHVRIDERVAGFTALGLARESGRPVAVVCTSGTAVANLHPAVLEAHHSGVPLVVLTADRPPELRGVGANQTTEQPGIFGTAVRLCIDAPVPDAGGDVDQVFRAIAGEAFEAARGADARPGPVQVNLPVREPLSGVLPPLELGVDEPLAATPAQPETDEVELERGPRTIVVAGAQAGSRAEQIAHEGGWPLIAEIVSGARFGRQLVAAYRDLLREPELGGRVERVVLFGRPTLSREVVALLSRPEVSVIAVEDVAETVTLHPETRVVRAVRVAAGESDRAWLGAWMRASRAAGVDLDPPAPDAAALSSADPPVRLAAISAELAAVRRPIDRVGLVDALWRATWPHDRLVFGSSRLVRVADAVLPGKPVRVHANRGLAGIDGTVATAVGVALASQRDGAPGVTRLLLGDLAFLYDVGALLLPERESVPRLQVVIGNDGGGTIFDGLEVAEVAGEQDLERVLRTPQSVEVAALARAYGWEYQQPRTRSELDQALIAPVSVPQIIEVALPR